MLKINFHYLTKSKSTLLDGDISFPKIQTTKYSYCEHGNLVKTETYIEGEEKEKGIDITERVCDDKGNIVKEFSYNSLDSSTKFYKENEYKEDGTVTAELDETGENKTALEYFDGTNRIKTETLPNGSKLSYGYDSEGNVTSITQSTDDGESNSTETRYTYGSPTRLKSGNNTVLYEYDAKRRITKANTNGKLAFYGYADGEATEKITICDKEFVSVNADRTTVTLVDKVITDKKADNIVTTGDGKVYETFTDENGKIDKKEVESNFFETFTDKNGNTVMTKADGQVLTACIYDDDGDVLFSGDGLTGNIKEYEYSVDGSKELQRVTVTASNQDVELQEDYNYSIGQICGKYISGAVDHVYAYYYKDHTASELEHIALPNGLSCYPQTDVNGRNTGKILKNRNNNNNDVYGEYIYYRKVGDHGTNMPSSIYFGKNKSGRYSISDNIKYKYDESGNITEVKENGILTVRYTYDKLGRLVREDNRIFGLTTLWSYDNCGNILTKREAPFTLKPTDEIEDFTGKQYAYKGDKLLLFGMEEVYYGGPDKESGYPEKYRNHDLLWNYGKQLVKFDDVEFSYDCYNRRLRKRNIRFTYDADNRLIKQSDGEK